MPQFLMTLAEFSAECRRVLRALPAEFADGLSKVVVDALDEPSAAMLASLDPPWNPDEDDDLLGLFQGVPLTEWIDGNYLPNQIYLFRGPLDRVSGTRAELRRNISDTLLHELAHHFGYEEEQLDDFEARCAREIERRFGGRH